MEMENVYMVGKKSNPRYTIADRKYFSVSVPGELQGSIMFVKLNC